ncbi:MAG: arginine--tRNA ligase [Sandaracinaceae bacterium]|nr:arginine--tRNA ligase [Sandaracinaceae bacterium]MDW8247216.1 arginine--tRNA ligase [Sandaracinaceae bacterium]
MRVEQHLEARVRQTIQEALGVDADPLLRPTKDPALGDYQLNAAFALAKSQKSSPRQIAERIAQALQGAPEFASVEVAGGGFINLRLSEEWMGEVLAQMLGDQRLGVPLVSRPERIVVDYSGPNIAKQMHVGHLRSTILGHAIISLLRFIGHEVIGDNHLGDWGTQFGILIAALREFRGGDSSGLDISGLEALYRDGTRKASEDPAFAERARLELARLQQGDAENRALWERFVALTRAEIEPIYERLGVRFDLWLGESFYQPMLGPTVQMLLERGIAREDEGAVCVFFNEWKERLGEAAPGRLANHKEPLIVKKRDGAYLYSTTDIATVIYRSEELRANRALYVVDMRQSLHFEQVFAIAKRLGYPIELEHVGFGAVLDAEGKPLKTREGKAITLAALLDEAEKRAFEVMKSENIFEISVDEMALIARAVGIGAVKYADLKQNRLSDYVFDFDKLIDLKGNSGPYMQYAGARVRSIFRKGGIDPLGLRVKRVLLQSPEERSLGRVLLRFPEIIHRAAQAREPHQLTDHLYALSREFSLFFERCPVLRSEGATRDSRLALTALVGAQIQKGLELLGIEAVERM